MSTMAAEKTETVTVGSPRFGGGVEMTVVTIEGSTFLTTRATYFEPCGRCDNHSGVIRAFGHVFEGQCFGCSGRGFSRKVGDLADATRIAKRRNADHARADRKRADEAAAQTAERDAWAAAHPTVAARLAGIMPTDDEAAVYAAYEVYGEFIAGLASRAHMCALTEAQTVAVEKALAEHDSKAQAKAEKAAAARHYGAEKDKVEITGTVVTAMNVDGYAYNSTDRLLVIEGTGEAAGSTFKIVGSGQTLWDADRGDSVTVKATVKRHTEYNGLPQTVLTRAKVAVVPSA